MDERKNHNLTCLNLIHQPIRLYEQFTDGFITEFGNDLPAFRKVSERSSGLLDLANKSSRVELGIPGDEFRGALQIIPGGFGPDYLSIHRAIRRSASCWEIISPRSAASRPRSIFWRT